MLLMRITEFCRWENERWTYVIDISEQEGACLDWLFIFIRLANQYHNKAQEEAKNNTPSISGGFFARHTLTPFAASRYDIGFYNKIVNEENSNMVLGYNNLPGKMHLDFSKGDYKNGANMIGRKISPFRMKSAMSAIRDKNEN